jgi:hypothetical protein
VPVEEFIEKIVVGRLSRVDAADLVAAEETRVDVVALREEAAARRRSTRLRLQSPGGSQADCGQSAGTGQVLGLPADIYDERARRTAIARFPEGTIVNRQMTPAVERLVRLMVLLPEHDHPLWKSLIGDCGDTTEVMSMRWFVGDSAKMWPEAGPGNLARAVLTTFARASDATLHILSAVLLADSARPGGPSPGPQAGAAWVTQASAAAIDVLAQERSAEELLQEVAEHWSLRS